MSQIPGSIDYTLLIETTGNLHTTARIENGIIHLTIAQRGAESPLSSQDETFCEVIKSRQVVCVVSSVDVNPASMMTGDLKTRMDLEKWTRKEREGFDQLKEPSWFLSSNEREIETIKIRMVGKAMEETNQRAEPIQSKKAVKQRENDRLRNHLDDLEFGEPSYPSLARMVDSLHLQITLDLSREKILKILGRRSWQALGDEVSKQGLTLQDYIYTSLAKDPANVLSQDIIDFICTRNRIVPGECPKIPKVEGLYDFVNGVISPKSYGSLA